MTVYRSNDRIVIEEPDIFVRCGYPFDIRAESERLMRTYGDSMVKAIDIMDPENIGKGVPSLASVFNRVAYAIAARNGHGGNERKIYTEHCEELRGVKCYVHSKRVVKTGVRYGPWSNGEDYEPGGLDNCKTHVVLKVFVEYQGTEDFDLSLMVDYANGFEIESTKVSHAV